MVARRQAAQLLAPEANLSVISASGGTPRALLRAPGVEQPASWSPDGKRILLTRYDAHGASVFVTRADGSGAKRLADGIAGSWSPDGRKIVYAASFGGPLFVMNADAPGERRLTSFRAADPSWR